MYGPQGDILGIPVIVCPWPVQTTCHKRMRVQPGELGCGTGKISMGDIACTTYMYVANFHHLIQVVLYYYLFAINPVYL